MSDEENYNEVNESVDEENESDEDLNLDEDQNEDEDADQDDQDEQDNEDDNVDQEEENAEESAPASNKLAKTKKVINTKKLSKYVVADDNKGVIYLSSVPMFMSPSRLRAMMGQFGEIGSLYLAPEGKDIQKSRKKSGGNGRKRWVEGWVEFMDKRIAKRVAESLNGTPVGGQKRSKFYDQMWNIKYLKDVKWRHLKEQMAYEISVRKSKLRAQISRGKREMEEYRKNFETSKRIAKRKRLEQEAANNNTETPQDTETISNNDNNIEAPPKPSKPVEKKIQKSPLEKPKPAVTSDPRFQTHKPKLAALSDPRFKMDNSSKWKAAMNDDIFGETKEDQPQAKKKLKSK